MKTDFTEREKEYLRKKIEADKEREQQELLERRMAWAAEIVRLEQEKNEALPKMKADLDRKNKKFETERKSLEITRTDAGKARVGFSQAQHRFSTSIGNAEAELHATADPAIDEALEHFQELHNEIRDPGNFRRYAKKSSFFSIFKDKTIPAQMESNSKAMGQALQYCRDSKKMLEAMKLEPEADLEKIEGLKNGLPDFMNTFADHNEPKPFADLPEGTKFLPPRIASKTERLLDQCSKQFNI